METGFVSLGALCRIVWKRGKADVEGATPDRLWPSRPKPNPAGGRFQGCKMGSLLFVNLVAKDSRR